MKRIFAIVLLHVMLLVAIQPIVAMHFCGGKLYSLSFMEHDDMGECCEAPVKHVEEQSCCSTEHAENPFYHTCVETTGADCCDLQMYQFQTDSFQAEINSISLTKTVHSFDIPWLSINSLCKQTEQTNNNSFLSDAFPAEGLFLKDVSINTFVCVYRI
ncbi:MAG: hypothetical protein GX102_04945 [Porphyromonadaceae bacterium]|nr:hypothetical protein [Porphyromonadaceae bacterium]